MAEWQRLAPVRQLALLEVQALSLAPGRVARRRMQRSRRWQQSRLIGSGICDDSTCVAWTQVPPRRVSIDVGYRFGSGAMVWRGSGNNLTVGQSRNHLLYARRYARETVLEIRGLGVILTSHHAFVNHENLETWHRRPANIYNVQGSDCKLTTRSNLSPVIIAQAGGRPWVIR